MTFIFIHKSCETEHILIFIVIFRDFQFSLEYLDIVKILKFSLSQVSSLKSSILNPDLHLQVDANVQTWAKIATEWQIYYTLRRIFKKQEMLVYSNYTFCMDVSPNLGLLLFVCFFYICLSYNSSFFCSKSFSLQCLTSKSNDFSWKNVYLR